MNYLNRDERIERTYIEEEEVDVYTTVQGDTWDIIAFKVYGEERYMSRLIEANLEHINTFIFKSGIEIICPDIEDKLPSSLPPWKQL